MAYYHILKQRRLDLNLSVQDVSIQTHLKPEYIRAIEDNQLDVFSDDFSYVRYFIHSYCDAIGVNWSMVCAEVDDNIFAYAAARDQAISQAQKKMIQNMPAAKPSKKTVRKSTKKRKKKTMQKSAAKISRGLSKNSKNKLTRLIIIAGVCGVAVLAIANTVIENQNAKTLEAAKNQKVQELQDKEEETQKLADDLRDKKGLNTSGDTETTQTEQTVVPELTPIDDTVNEYTVSGLQEGQPITLTFSTAVQSQVSIYLDGTLIYLQDVTGEESYPVSGSQDSKVQILFGMSSGNTLAINGVSVEIDEEVLAENPQDGVELVLEYTASPTDTE